MEPVPPLLEVLGQLIGSSSDPNTVLQDAGHVDLPPHLVAQAIVNYADTAPVEVAEHLSPFVVAHSGVPQGEDAPGIGSDTGDGLALLQSAPTPHDDAHHDLHTADHQSLVDVGTGTHADDGHADDGHADDGHVAPETHADLFFGAGEPADTNAVHDVDPGHQAPAATETEATGHELGQEPDVGLGHEGWLDVTSASVEPDHDLDHDTDHDAWTHATDGDASPLAEPMGEHHGEDPLDHGTGA